MIRSWKRRYVLTLIKIHSLDEPVTENLTKRDCLLGFFKSVLADKRIKSSFKREIVEEQLSWRITVDEWFFYYDPRRWITMAECVR